MASQAPPGIDLTEDKRSNVLGAVLTVLVLATIAVGLRAKARALSNAPFWWDDWVLGLSLLFAYVNAVITILAIKDGVGLHLWASGVDILSVNKLLWVYMFLWGTLVSVTKMSFVLLYHRLFPTASHQRILYGISFLVIGWWIAVVVTVGLQCRPYYYFWTQYMPDSAGTGTCIDVNTFSLVNAGLSVMNDFILLIFPLPTILRLHSPRKKKLVLIGIFLPAGFACIAGVIRIYFVSSLFNSADATWAQADGFIWSSIESSVGIICACLPTLRPLIRAVNSRWLSTTGSSSGKTVSSYPKFQFRTRPNKPSHRTTEDEIQLTGAIVDDQLYFMAGTYSIEQSDGTQQSGTSGNLYHLALDSEFPVESNISSADLATDSIDRTQTLAYDSAVDSSGGDSQGALWAFNNTLYSFAGGKPDTTPTNIISRYDIPTGEWKDVEVSGGNFNFGQRESAAFATAPEAGLGFVLGGYKPHLAMARLEWNRRTSGLGGLVYIPAGNQGMLVSFGGRNVSEILAGKKGETVEADWLNVYVYDIESHTWWLQKASGSVPENRLSFCTAATQSPDGSAFHITTYGGWSREDGRSYESVYILSIPAFQWIDATDVSDSTNSEVPTDSRKIGRDALCGACHTYRGSQMVLLGSQVREKSKAIYNSTCSAVYNPVRVLDLSTYEWKNSLDTESTYQVPPVTTRAIGGDSNGGATATVPAHGFVNDTPASLIMKRVGSSTSSDSPSSDNSNPSSDQDSSGSTNKGAIAGGVVGGVAGLALIAGLFWFVHRKRSEKRQQSTAEAFGPVEDKKQPDLPFVQRNELSEIGTTEHPSATHAELHGDTRHELP
ncbi:hypothetical protein BDV18DRAFT_155220 [Aspergillus unguis]